MIALSRREPRAAEVESDRAYAVSLGGWPDTPW